MYCKECGFMMEDGTEICPVCGARQDFDELDYLGLQYRQGDESAFQKIYQNTERWVRKFVYARVTPSEVEDCMQQIYIKLFQNIGSFEPDKGSFRPWFNTLVNHETVSYMRKNMRPERMEQVSMVNEEDDSVFEFEAPDRYLPEEQMDQQETSRLVQEILMQLSEEQRQCIMLKYMENMKIKEIAELLGVSKGTVKSRLAYGLKKVEGKVVDLERKGTKLYGFQPIPFFLAVLAICSPEASTWSGGLWMMICQDINNLVSGAAGAGFAGAGAVAAGVGDAAGVMEGTSGTGATMAGTGAAGAGATATGTGTAGVAASAVGKAIAAKVIAAVIGVAIVAGGTVGIAHYIKEKKEDNGKVEITTTEMAMNTGTDAAQITTEATTEEVTTEEVADAKTERYQAYYDIVKTYMEEYPTTVSLGGGGHLSGFVFADLVDFNQDGNEQLVMAYNSQIEVYDFVDGETKQILSVESNSHQFPYGSNICYGSDEQHTWLYVYCDNNPDGFGDMDISAKQYEYIDGEMVMTHICEKQGLNPECPELSEEGQSHYRVDGQEVTQDVCERTFESMEQNLNAYIFEFGYEAVIGTEHYLHVEKTLSKKHETIRILAEAANDAAFLNQTSELQQCFTFGELDGIKYNEYMEKYIIQVGELSITYSENGKAAHMVTPENSESYDKYDFCVIYEDGVLKLVGNRDFGGTPKWFEGDVYKEENPETLMDVYLSSNITESEYTQKINEILSTY